MDMKLSNNPYKSYALFQNRIIEQYKNMIDEFDLIKIDAMQTIHQKQEFIRKEVAELLKKNKISKLVKNRKKNKKIKKIEKRKKMINSNHQLHFEHA